jgi:hypothetical protein
MRQFHFASGLAALLLLAGCASAPKYQAVDLKSDLDPSALARYKAEAAQAGPAAQPAGECCHTVLERTDGQLLGALIYWDGGSAEAMTVEGAPVYMISQTFGIGPLALLYVSRTSAIYDGNGRRLSAMSGSTIAWGCVAMTHSMETRLNGDHWHNHWMGHFIHHVFGVSLMDGRTTFALFSMPNPIMIGD